MTDLEIFLSYDDPVQEKESVFIVKQVEEDLPPYIEEQDRSTADNQQFNNNNDISEEVNEEEEDYLLLSDTLSPLEKLIQFSNSSLVLQRLVVTKDLISIIKSITLKDAVLVALPIVLQLGKDNDESVREAVAAELDEIIYFYYKNAPPVAQQDQLAIPNHAFVSIIIHFLLDQNTTLASIAQQSIVSVAAELAKTPKHDTHYTLHQDLLKKEIFEGVVLGLLNMFAEKDQDETDIMKSYDDGTENLAKMVCLMLISALAPDFGADFCKEKMLPIVEGMETDAMFYVRKEVAAAVGSLATTVDPDVALERLLPLYLTLSVDTIWHVRRACVFSLPLLCQVLPTEKKTEIAVEGVRMFQNDVSRNVRNSLADIVGELIAKFLPEDWEETGKPGEIPETLFDFFLSLGDSSTVTKLDTERVHNCAYSFPAVALTAGTDYWDSHLKHVYLHLTKDYQLRVRRTFACSLHEIARIIGPDRTERDLIQIFALYLMDMDEVKQGVLEHLAEFMNVLEVASRNEYIPILTEVWDGVSSNWYLRDILTNQLKHIAPLFDASRVVEYIFPLALRACQDEFAAIRQSGVEIIPVILGIVKQAVDEDGENLSQVDLDETSLDDTDEEKRKKLAEALLIHVMEKLDDLLRSQNYRTRLIFTYICNSLLTADISPTDFASFFLPRLAELVKDPIVNVRIAVSRTVGALCAKERYTHDLQSLAIPEDSGISAPEQLLEDIYYHLSTDDDQDVRGFVSSYISKEKLESYQQRKQVHDLQVLDVNAGEDAADSNLPVTLDHLTVFFSSLSNLDEDDMMEDEEEATERVMDSPIITDMDYFDENNKAEDEAMIEASESNIEVKVALLENPTSITG